MTTMPRSPEKSKEPENLPFRLPGRQEFQVLEVLWVRSPLTVAEVRAVWPGSPRLAYTTVMTMLVQLFRKGLVDRSKRGKADLYVPRVEREVLLRAVARRVLADFFQADPERFRQALLDWPGLRDRDAETVPSAARSGDGAAARGKRGSGRRVPADEPPAERFTEDDVYLL